MTRLALPRLPVYRLPELATRPKPPKVPKQGPVLSPEEERSLLKSGMGAVQYLGESLDKPAAAIRGLLGTGDPSQLLHAVPFSEAMGLAPKKKLSGRELLRRGGMVSRNRPGLDWGDVGGFATEVALDPLWLLAGLPLVKGVATGAAASAKAAKGLTGARAAFRAAEKAAKVPGAVLSRTPPTVPAALAAQIRAGKRGVVGLRVPFAAEPLVTFGQGSKTAAWAMEKMAYGFTGKFNPLTWMRGLFSHSAGAKTMDEFFAFGTLQRSKDIAYAERQMLGDAIENMAPSLLERGDDLAAKFTQIAKHAKGNGDRAAFEAFTRAALEAKGGLPAADDLGRLLARHAELPATVSLDDVVEATGRMGDDFHEYIDTIREVQDAAYRRVESLGGRAPLLDDLYAAHQARRPSLMALSAKEMREGQAGRFRPWLSRRDVYRNLPGGAHTVNALARDPLLTGTAKLTGKEKTLLRGGLSPQQKKKLLGDGTKAHSGLRDRLDDLGVTWDSKDSIEILQERYAWSQHLKGPFEETWAANTVDEAGQLLDDAGEVVRYQRGAMKGQAISRKSELARFLEPQFDATVIPSAAARVKSKPGQLTRLVRHFRHLPKEMRLNGIFDRTVIEDTLDYTHSILEWESTLRSAHHFLGSSGAVGRASQGAAGKSLKEAWREIKLPGARGRPRRALSDDGLETFAKTHFPDAELDDLVITPGAEKTLDAYIQSLRPQVQNEIGKFIDKVNGLFKGWLFVPWPAAHSRNLLSGLYQSWSDGRISLPELLAGYWKAAMHIHRGDPLESMNVIKSTGILKGIGPLTELAGEEAVSRMTTKPAGLFEFLKPFTPGRLKQKGLTAIDPFATRGFRETALSAPMEAGEEAYKLVEYLNRAGYAEALLKKGYSPAEIKHLVARSQFDYCVDESTEVLTRRGWLTWDQLDETDAALTLDPKTRKIQWQPIEAVNVFDHDGPINYSRTSRIDAVSTDNHQWLAEGCGKAGGHWSVRKRGETHFLRSADLGTRGKRLIVGGGTCCCGYDNQVYSDEFVRLVGWYVTEGSQCQTQYGLIVAQSAKRNPQYVEELRQLRSHFAHAGATATEYAPRDHGWGPIVSFYFGKGIGEKVRAVTPNKQLTPLFLGLLTERQLKILYKTLMDADGTRPQPAGRKPRDIWAQTDQGRLDSFQMLSAMLGKRTHSHRQPDGHSHVSVYSRQHVYTQYLAQKTRRVHYRGKVWCPTTAAGTWMARRNGVTYWTGNSQLSKFEQGVMKRGVLFYTWPRKNLPFTISKLIERPGGRTAQTFRAVRAARGDPEESYTPGFLKETMGARHPFTPGTEQAAHFIWQSGLPIEEFNKLVLGDVRRTGAKVGAYAHPLLQMPTELFAGEQLFTGRKLRDLRPLRGAPPAQRAAVQALHYSPFSRVLNEAMGLADPRKDVYQKGMNALTGFKTGTYDIEYWRQRDLQEALRRELEADPLVGEGTHYYVPEELKAEHPELVKKIRRRSALSRRIRDLRKEREAQQKGK